MLRRSELDSSGSTERGIPGSREPHLGCGGIVMVDGEPHVSIRDIDRMPPFLMNVVSNGDVWLFVGSNGGLTAGRRDPDLALFPYQTVDKLLATPQASGVVSLFRVNGSLWEPGRSQPLASGCIRHLHKHELGTSVVFEETNEPLGLRLRWRLATSEAFGIVRQCTLENIGGEVVEVRSLDGWRNMLPPGVNQQTYERYSYLAAAYMRHELLADDGFMISTLNAAISDRPQPAESLRATVAWSRGHRQPVRLLSPQSIDRFRAGAAVDSVRDVVREVRGDFGCYLVEDRFTLAAGEAAEWFVVADIGLDHAGVSDLRRRLSSVEPIRNAVVASLATDRAHLRRKVAASDGLQASADRTVAAHHFSNTLFNVMRGGVPSNGYRCPPGDFAGFVKSRNTVIHARHRAWLESVGERSLDSLTAEAERQGDPQLVRLAREYLPLCFSRRHGDPSRPWNRFSIATRDAHGAAIHGYSGNWRDIFQNWEALGHSHPACLPAMIAVFLNASTCDGYNPYRITRDGIDWEVSSPSDPWSHIGYWGDHQIVYLLRLLEAHERFWPGRLAAGLDSPAYAAATVPYRIAGFDDLLRDPRHSIMFDDDLHDRLQRRRADIGGDGVLATAADGEPRLFSLAEKLLVPALVKLTNLVPDGGVWLNTQRPEWNDANNALAGWGLSVVTVCHLHRYLVFLEGLVARYAGASLGLTVPTAELVEGVAEAVASWDRSDRFTLIEALGRAGERHRTAVYGGGADERWQVPVADIRRLLDAGRRLAEQTIRANRRNDGMYHGYNVLDITDGRADVRHLELMLEGQVAALSSGLLDDAAVLELLGALQASSLYREDQQSYMLQSDRVLPSYLDRNTLPAGWAVRCPTLAARVAAGDRGVVVVDGDGHGHFNGDLANAAELARRLEPLGLPKPEVAAALAIWEEVFQHASFTGRSGTFFGFEGLGSIYWHMVAKLLLAVQESHSRSSVTAKPDLQVAYAAIRDGLGFRKSAEEYGAFPTDAYSHTPRHAGAQQPGMTGQVKEEILTRLGELGVVVEQGCLRFRPELLDQGEFGAEAEFEFVDVDGRERCLEVPAGGLAFTFCQVPVVYAPAKEASIVIARRDGSEEVVAGDTLPAQASGDVFGRTGAIVRLTVRLGSQSRNTSP